MNFINRKKNEQSKIFCFYINAYKICEIDESDKMYEASSELEKNESKIISILIEKYKDMNEYTFPEQQLVHITCP